MKIYHNPRCSKSRQTLALLEEHGVSPEIIEYLKNPLAAEEVKQLKAKLGVDSVQDFVRKKEAAYKSNDLAQANDETLIAAIEKNPVLLERPIVVNGDKAVVGRPPENVLAILGK